MNNLESKIMEAVTEYSNGTSSNTGVVSEIISAFRADGWVNLSTRSLGEPVDYVDGNGIRWTGKRYDAYVTTETGETSND